MNSLLAMPKEKKDKGIVTASSGNHGAAVAFGLGKLNVRGKIFVPENASPTKVESIRNFGAEVQYYGADCGESESYARVYGEENGKAYISPYNDPTVIAGQGTIGLELARQIDCIDAIFVALGGGGLISGIAGYLKAAPNGSLIGAHQGKNDLRVFACSPENSPNMVASIRAGKIIDVESKPTLSDGTAGGIEPGAITFALCQKYVDDYVLVSEDEIKTALKMFINTHHMLIEGAAAVALAAVFKRQEDLRGKNVVVVLCGANIGLEDLKQVLA